MANFRLISAGRFNACNVRIFRLRVKLTVDCFIGPLELGMSIPLDRR
jgi:hypothetical protein